MTPKFFMYVGLPCSGKTSHAQHLAKLKNANIYSSDSIREELFGDVNNQDNNQLVFNTLHNRIKDDLRNGQDCIMDATNISSKRRRAFLQELSSITCEKNCIIMATPYEECIKRNRSRDRKVPEGIIRRMYMNFNIPYYYEGWDYIHIEYAAGTKDSYGNVLDWVVDMMHYDQHNSHHTLSLGAHCMKAYEHLISEPMRRWELSTAALLHDCGKPKTATYVNSKGETTEECHYYQHHCIGAYDSLFFRDIEDHLYVATLIQWHMRPFLVWKQSHKAIERDHKLLGDDLFNDIWQLHIADVNAH